MYNTDLPTRAELPSSARLWRSTIIAFVAAIAILITIVLPSEYGIDPTRIGRILGLTEMGAIKMQLSAEAEADRRSATQARVPVPDTQAVPAPQGGNAEIEMRLSAIEQRIDEIALLLYSGVQAPVGQSAPEQQAEQTQEQSALAVPASRPEETAPVNAWADEVSFTLQPGEGIELKLVMQEGAVAEFEWTANGAVLNYDTHGDGGGNKISYEKGRGVAEQTGSITAAFAGNHGWFWRNRTDQPVTLTLRTRGDYSELKRTV
ncbi:hypothetical protein [Hoeflea poritis]|uniref:Transmembrane anchor protein n=1 Tax=Hoeflea poritis TaxID=2993659 RepID=A0ABT4VU90_9HYPH|nr:hypothetical protein [Hoeflea poritis]MDA4848282.1 hypothetical protein [Hoeflea poritis]